MRKYGMIPTPFSPKHRVYTLKLQAVPSSVDLRGQCSPVFDQGQQGSCTAHAIVGLREFMEIKAGKTLISLSRAFLYYEERLKEGTQDQDAGAMPGDGMDTLENIGVCPATEMPYSDSDFTTAPTAQDVTDAAPYKIIAYHRLSTAEDCKDALANGQPVVIGIQVYDSFENSTGGIIPMPDVNNEQLQGGHCMLMVGYDDSKQTFIVRNSWGEIWGDNGYCYIPYAYLADNTLCSDMWVGTL
jgi:C1A family cysteine protease